jgi:methyl-accepting chemotaxis protein
MTRFIDLSTRAKLFIGFGLMLVFLAAVIGLAFFTTRSIVESQKRLYERDFAIALNLTGMENNLNGQRVAVLTMLSRPDPASLKALKDDVVQRSSENDEIAKKLQELSATDTELQSGLKKLSDIRDAFKRTRDGEVIPAVEAGRLDEARSKSLGVQRERFAQMQTIAKSLEEKAARRAEDAVADTVAKAKQATTIFLLAGLVALAIGVMMTLLLSRLIANPLRQISDVAGHIAEGDLSVEVASNHRRDEVGVLLQNFERMTVSLKGMADVAEHIAEGDLTVQVTPQSPRDTLGNAFFRMTRSLRDMAGVAGQIAEGDLRVVVNPQSDKDVLGAAFSRMTQSLQNVAGIAGRIAEGDLRVETKAQSDNDVLGNAFAGMVKNLQGVIADIAEATNVLSASAAEISASTSQLAASSTQTATAVTETTTTVEEIRQTAQVANEKAQHVAHSAQRVMEISQSGRNATAENAAGMQRIREQMDSIAESMVRLSEQSAAIGEIIATVDDLARQSNLLAVNAAIEAAKAGEQGKGFSVVASEVKSLADQSKQATMQVRTILSDIQKATGAAVMATEQGSKAVEAGVLQSTQAGESIVSLAESVSDAAQAATQIAASSQQQLVGMDQVVQAMESIKQASVQNVDGARQLETAAHDLTQLGQKLKSQAERYKV